MQQRSKWELLLIAMRIWRHAPSDPLREPITVLYLWSMNRLIDVITLNVLHILVWCQSWTEKNISSWMRNSHWRRYVVIKQHKSINSASAGYTQVVRFFFFFFLSMKEESNLSFWWCIDVVIKHNILQALNHQNWLVGSLLKASRTTLKLKSLPTLQLSSYFSALVSIRQPWWEKRAA